MAHGETGADAPGSPGAPGGRGAARPRRRACAGRPPPDAQPPGEAQRALATRCGASCSPPCARPTPTPRSGRSSSGAAVRASPPATTWRRIPREAPPWPITAADGGWARHVLQGWFEMMDMATPLIAQVHGYCLAGGTELATACDLVYVGRGRTDRLPAGAADEPARHGLAPVAARLAAGHGGHADRRLDVRDRGRGRRLRQPRLPGGRAGRGRAGDRRAGVPRCRPTSRRSTSGSSTGPWRAWACATPCGPRPTSTRSASTSARAGRTSRSSEPA